MKSLINIIPRKNASGEAYYQARFFDKSGLLIKSMSFPGIKSHSEAYLYAREKMIEVLSLYVPLEDIKQHGLLSIEEVKAILALPYDEPHKARDVLITLLGITCGLGISEIRFLERTHITKNDFLMVENNEKRIIPLIENVKTRIQAMNKHNPESRYVIPNFRDNGKPCDSISINRGVSAVLSQTGIKAERYIVPSVLKETFITLLSTCNKDIEMDTIDYLCGFNAQETELSKMRKFQIIEAINKMMILLEDLHFSATSIMKWLDSN